MLRAIGFFKLLALLALLAGVGYFAHQQGAFQLITGLMGQRLVAAEVRVFLNGEPLHRSDVTIRTYPEDSHSPGAAGVLDSGGFFTFQTMDESGKPVPGIAPGIHKVTVGVYGMATAGPPPLLSPAEYADQLTTPFKIKISGNSSWNKDFKFELEGEIRSARGAGGPPPPPGGGDGGGPAGGGNGGGPGGGRGGDRPLSETARLMLSVTFKRLDTNADGKLSTDELQLMNAEDRKSLKVEGADKDGDGFLTRDELAKSINGG